MVAPQNSSIKARSITVGNMFKLVEAVRHDMAKDGYCFIAEQRSGNSQPQDYIYLVSELSDATEISIANQKKPESMDLQSHHLRAYFQRERIHPKDKYQHLYSPLPPKLVLTYEWSMTFRELRGFLNSENIRKHNKTDAEAGLRDFESGDSANFLNLLDMMVFLLQCMCCLWCIPFPSSPPGQIDACPMWIDILFNDQNAIDIKAELDRAELIYIYARYHLVIASASVLTRAWCLFEIMTRLKSVRKKVSILHNWSKGATKYHVEQVSNVFDEMQASYQSDKELIQSMILSKFGNKDTFHAALRMVVDISSDDSLQGGFGSCFYAVGMFLVLWIVFLIFSPCTVPLVLILCYFVLTEKKNEQDFYDLMLHNPSTASQDGTLEITINP
jgi:hypothetical protein